MLDRSELLDFLGLIAEHLQKEIVLVAAGGTGLTLLDLKESTRDVDFTGPEDSIEAFRSALEKEPHGFKVDTWTDGWVFATHLPSDYLKNAIPIEELPRIHLYVLHPIDIVVSKIGRFDARDQEDIWSAIRKYGLTPRAIQERAANISYVANEKNYAYNLKLLLQQMRAK